MAEASRRRLELEAAASMLSSVDALPAAAVASQESLAPAAADVAATAAAVTEDSTSSVPALAVPAPVMPPNMMPPHMIPGT